MPHAKEASGTPDETQEGTHTGIHLFWEREEVNWTPGSGHRAEFRLLGRQGVNKPTLRVADFRRQHGLYVLYGDYGPHYVGLTRERGGLGDRLKAHNRDHHANSWGRFCWFGFCRNPHEQAS